MAPETKAAQAMPTPPIGTPRAKHKRGNFTPSEIFVVAVLNRFSGSDGSL